MRVQYWTLQHFRIMNRRLSPCDVSYLCSCNYFVSIDLFCQSLCQYITQVFKIITDCKLSGSQDPYISLSPFIVAGVASKTGITYDVIPLYRGQWWWRMLNYDWKCSPLFALPYTLLEWYLDWVEAKLKALGMPQLFSARKTPLPQQQKLGTSPELWKI